MQTFKTVGNDAIKRAFTAQHCKRLATWFNGKGTFVHDGQLPTTRERLWNCLSLLTQGGAGNVRLAEAIILATPADHNHFEPIIAVELLVRFKKMLSAKAVAHLEDMLRRQLANVMEIRLGFGGIVNNYTCMMSFCLAAAGQVLDRYDFKHEFASIPEVYVGARLTAMGNTSLRAVAHASEHEPVATEFNSPSYSPISITAMAKTVELIHDEESRQLALAIEGRLWREVLALYHPHLGLSCGPYSRAYRVDVLGQSSCMRFLLCYLGLSKDRSLLPLLDGSQKGMVLHHDGDESYNWSEAAWLISSKCHVPTDALAEMKKRVFPHRFRASFSWGSFGYIDRRKKTLVSVQGDAVPGGKTELLQIQGPRHALGLRTYNAWGHSFSLMFHYALKPTVRTMRDVRNVTGALMFTGKPVEWTDGPRGKPIEYVNFNHVGKMHLAENAKGVSFQGQCLAELAALPTDELSVNTVIPTHFAEVDQVTLNGQTFLGDPLVLKGRSALCQVRDHGWEYEFEYSFPKPVEIRLFRWANFIRFAGFWYEGKSRSFSAAALNGFKVHGRFKILRGLS